MDGKMSGKILAGLAVMLCVIVVTGAAGCGGGSTNGSAGPGQVVQDFWESAARGDAQAAYALFSSEDQAEMAYEDFERIVAEDPPGEGFQVELFSEIIKGDIATVRASAGGGNTDFDLVKEGGAWKLDGIAGYISRAHERVAKVECINNIKALEVAVVQYGIANNYAYPQTIDKLIPQYIGEVPVCPEGGTYTINLDGTYPVASCSVHGTR